MQDFKIAQIMERLNEMLDSEPTLDHLATTIQIDPDLLRWALKGVLPTAIWVEIGIATEVIKKDDLMIAFTEPPIKAFITLKD